MEIVIINEREALMIFPDRQIKLWSGDGKVRDLVRFMLIPFEVSDTFKDPDAYDRALISSMEDTGPIKVA